MKKKVIWITGASSGIGRALSIKFAEKNWIVAVSARREEKLKELTNINENIFSFPLDVTIPDDCIKVANQIIKDLGAIDLCVFGTGIHDPKSEMKFNLDSINSIMNVNFFGTINTINSIYDYFYKRENGHISKISSVAGYRGLPAAGAYCASKSALISFSESLYFDLIRKNVRVSVISPGFIKTPMTDKNDFPMPMIRSTEFAAEKIYKGLIDENLFEIHFPKGFTYLMKIIQLMPNWLYFKMINLGNRFMKRDPNIK